MVGLSANNPSAIMDSSQPYGPQYVSGRATMKPENTP